MNKSTISKQRSYLTDLFSTLAVKSHRRSTLWLMLFTLLLLPTSMVAQTDYDTSVTFSALAGSPEGFDNEKYTNLFDGLKDPGNSTKWCDKFVSNGGTYVIFEASKAGIPVGYTITTGNDNSAYKGRNPRSWKLYGNNEGKNGAWTLIQEVSYDTKLQDVNCASYDFTCEGSTPYKYFKWEITGIKNKDYIQVGEFELKLNTGYQVYAEFDEGTGTLTFKYGPSTSKPEGAYKLNVGPYLPGWHAQKEKIKTVVFDASFAIARPTTCNTWFSGCKNLTDIKGIENLNTEKVTSMIYMFDGCTKLESLDLTNFNTAVVKSMTYMFYNCSTLTSLNLSNFNTAKVTDMSSMFEGCTKLASLDLSNFNTEKVMYMSNMFYNCSALTSLDLRKFNTAKVTEMSNMFYNCSALTTIFASDKFVTDLVTKSTDMFSGCKNLIGAIGYDETNTNNKDYANLVDGYFTPEGGFHAYAEFDEGTGTLTFRRGVSKPEGAYELNEGRSNPKWYDKREKINKVVFDASFASARPTSCYYWFTRCSNLTTIEGIEYLNTEKVTDMSCMFFHCSSLTSLDLSNFNTANVTDMGYMFNGCSALTTIFVSDKFVTSQVTKSVDMFSGCNKLIGAIKYAENTTNNKDYANYQTGYFTPKGGFPGYAKFDEGTGTLTFTSGPSKPEGAYDLNVGIYYPGWWPGQRGKIKTVVFDASFANARPTSCYCWFSGCNNLTEIKGIEYLNTENVTNMGFMFNSCKVLTSLNLSNFNTEKVTDMQGMFGECSDLTSLNLSNFNTEKVTNMRQMFYNCSDLTSLNLSNFNTEKVMYMSNMFYNCNKLTSLDLTSFNTAEVTKMDNMFKSCTDLTSLDLSNFNTAKVTDMNYMFYNCNALTSLDITSFNTANVKDMTQMFYGSNALTTIYASDNFVTSKVTTSINKSINMFSGCNELIGAIKYAGNNTNDKDYANYKTGYFTKLVGKNGNDKIGATGEVLTAESLALDDDKDFVAYEPFAAKTASYSRTMNAGTTWGTLCLPFEVSLDGKNFRAFKLLSADEGTETVELEEVKTIEAGTPVIIKMNDGETQLNFTVANKAIANEVKTAATADGNYQLHGLYTQKEFSKDADNNCYIVKGNKLMNPAKLLVNTSTTQVGSKPFRAYMVDNSTTPAAGAKMFSIGFDNDGTTAIDSLNTIADNNATYYDLQGKRLNEPQKGINIVKRNGKTMKVIIK
ncbi:BspA family leucine-rich repeat surface protein [Prevotella sp.]|uniref:BspA family leucine-rich repeat surface protein n=1 Tax=Prevotella sp. TaxID=59823 RepID=UPI003AB2FF5C